MTNLERVRSAQDSCIQAAAILREAQVKDSDIWIHGRVQTALTLVRQANAALEHLSQDLLGCGNNNTKH